MKTLKILLGAATSLVLATAPASALIYHWTAGAGTTDWFTLNNWNQTSFPYPRSGDSPRLGISSSYNPTLWPHYNGDNSASPTTGAFLIAQVMEAWFYMVGGTNLHDSWVNIGNGGGFTGHWIQTGGTFANPGRQFSVGNASPGEFSITGGWLICGDFRLSTSATGWGTGLIGGTGWVEAGQAQIGMYNVGTLTIQDSGRLQLNTWLQMGNTANGGVGLIHLLGGKVYADNVSFNTTASKIRLDGGVLELGGDETPNAPTWIAGGHLYTTIPDAVVGYFYNAEKNRTLFLAIPEPGSVGLLITGLAFWLAGWRQRRQNNCVGPE